MILSPSVNSALAPIPSAQATAEGVLPPTVISAVIIFAVGTLFSLSFRYRDRQQRQREQRLEAAVQFLASIRHIIGLEAGQARNWVGRTEAVDKMHASYVLLKSRAPVGQQSTFNWLMSIMDAVQYDDEWQDPELFQETIAEPLFAWTQDPRIETWFSKRLEVLPLKPVPFDPESVPAVSGMGRQFARWSRRNLHR